MVTPQWLVAKICTSPCLRRETLPTRVQDAICELTERRRSPLSVRDFDGGVVAELKVRGLGGLTKTGLGLQGLRSE